MMRTLLAALFVVFAQTAWAVQPDEMLSNPKLEARARSISKELRCLQCQNQSIDDSEAPLARDLRLLVRERIAAGDSDAQVINFLVARYGEFVLLKPRFERQTLLLWLIPPLVLFGGGAALWMHTRRRANAPPPLSPSLSAEEEAKIAALMSADATAEDPGQSARTGSRSQQARGHTREAT